MRLRYLLLVLSAAVLTSQTQAAWAAFPVAEPTAFPVSTSLFDHSPGVATDGQGNSVVVWSRTVLPRMEVVARRFDPQGKPLGGMLQVNSNGNLPTVAMSSRGDFVVAWVDAGLPRPGTGSPMRVQLFSANGAKVGRTTQLNTPVETPSTLPVIGIDENGGFAVTWSSHSGTFLRRFDSKGAPLGGEILVDANGSYSSLAMRPDGSFTLVWHGSGLLGRRFGADGEPEGADFQVNQSAVSNTQTLNVATTQGGGFVAAWDVCASQAPTSRGVQPCDVRARRFDAGAQPLGDEFAVSPADGRGNQKPVAAGEDGHGYFAISWHSCLNFKDCRISTQLYSPAGVPATRAATASIGSDATSPAIAVSPTGFVVAFSSSVCTSFFPGCRATRPKGIYLWRFDFP